ncbi:MAG: ribulose 1,5-bisphosphate carboxylase [Gemmatimonadetes bacterium]|nr:ribulose 1,5-bisphosphate carboxylase [Gemmatimonadota bacterium]
MTPQDGARAVYRLGVLPSGATGGDARARALAVARESTLEVPAGVASPAIEADLLGRLVELRPEDDGSVHAVIDYPGGIFDGSLPQLLNVLHGNISLLPGVRLVDVELSEGLCRAFPGPRFGISGIRERAASDAVGRPMVAAALKPVGLETPELASLAAGFARAGIDVIKDDHGVTDQAPSRFDDRVQRVAEAVLDTNAATGGSTAYYVNVTGPLESLTQRVSRAEEAGCGGVLIAPGLMGLEAMRMLAAGPTALPIMAHPSRGDVGPDRDSGISPELWYGLLYRLVGADSVVYVNAGGRFAWSLDTCNALNRRLREPLGSLRPALPVPAGGVQADDAPEWFRRYGSDTLVLIGGSLLAQPDPEAAARALVDQARRVAVDGESSLA